MSRIGFLEDQSQSIYSWTNAFDRQTYALVGMQGYLHLLNGSMEIVRSTKAWDNMQSAIVRIVGVSDNTNVFLVSGCGGCGFLSTNPNSFASADITRFGNSVDSSNLTVDGDIHGSGNLAALLSLSSISLVDPSREAIVGQVPVGFTGSANCLRISDSNSIVAGSMVCSLYDVRMSHQAKTGVPASVLGTTPEFYGRCFTAIEADGVNSVIAGDSAGGMWLWDVRKNTEPLKSVHSHSGAVLSVSLNEGLVASSGTDGSVSLWSLLTKADGDSHPKKKFKKLAMLETDNIISSTSANLKRMAVEGSGAALCINIEDATNEKHVAYVTDTGLAVLTPISAFYQ